MFIPSTTAHILISLSHNRITWLYITIIIAIILACYTQIPIAGHANAGFMTVLFSYTSIIVIQNIIGSINIAIAAILVTLATIYTVICTIYQYRVLSTEFEEIEACIANIRTDPTVESYPIYKRIHEYFYDTVGIYFSMAKKYTEILITQCLCKHRSIAVYGPWILLRKRCILMIVLCAIVNILAILQVSIYKEPLAIAHVDVSHTGIPGIDLYRDAIQYEHIQDTLTEKARYEYIRDHESNSIDQKTLQTAASDISIVYSCAHHTYMLYSTLLVLAKQEQNKQEAVEKHQKQQEFESVKDIPVITTIPDGLQK